MHPLQKRTIADQWAAHYRPLTYIPPAPIHLPEHLYQTLWIIKALDITGMVPVAQWRGVSLDTVYYALRRLLDLGLVRKVTHGLYQWTGKRFSC